MAHALRFRAMLADLGLSYPEAAKMLHVSLRTLHNWLSGRHAVPYAAYKLLRLLRYMELPGEAWAGWHFSRGQLVTPEGRTISGKDGSWWSLLVRQAHGFGDLYRELQLARIMAYSLRLPAQLPTPGNYPIGAPRPQRLNVPGCSMNHTPRLWKPEARPQDCCQTSTLQRQTLTHRRDQRFLPVEPPAQGPTRLLAAPGDVQRARRWLLAQQLLHEPSSGKVGLRRATRQVTAGDAGQQYGLLGL